MTKNWNGKRYHNLNYFLREKFGEKVFKISLDAGFSCPNRDGTISKGGCVFCSERGSGDFAGDRCFSISKQFEDIKIMMNKKWKDGKYIAYFQAYTNTYASVDILREKYEEAINQQDVVALAIATRPDCLGEDVLDLIEEYSSKVYTWVELGLQTSKDKTAKLINRGYELSVFEESIRNLRKRNIDVVTHIIFGLPGENKKDMINTINYVAHSDVQGVKIHLLHLMKNTPLEKFYKSGNLKLMDMEEYIDLICEAITLLPEDMVIHRLTGDAPRDLLIGPMWSLKKWEVLNAIDKRLEDENLYQGINFKGEIL
ncbi:MAG: TIGR01212 family radical SAM protein [Clostridium argentinense]|uniref:TIGR01212 family radical SAM protein n=1 Tax=Clostridium faecium TaxID=2762223 RepID=A0ABR8YQC7_9CLOT|nr:MULTISPECIES: TIGR01212 family radical SAM protein [Clostridium]MBD8046211.1 TIGR01212 family radical SAM protein [Clostridium faecium]MBS5822263.1 TIGR01212 family radical SAM protein [Clostridium argentinense]MDU1348560.1 TIGR01212 family radical SAM protein [Clostridium argentinense]